MFITDILAFNFFRYSTTLYSNLGDYSVCMLIGFLRGEKGDFG
jgi:hypothetical protein